VSWDDVYKAMTAYQRIVGMLSKAVFVQVLKQQDHPDVKSFLAIPSISTETHSEKKKEPATTGDSNC